ncbi:hypothetical protein B0H65DRAFT_466250 [Neurospora tetraspora]|uniref:Uncharacterized protein n=1 Tax=Neurospora tetraspora TaxID=94610 RepID=A0AAE0JFG3_9PEZI|nr:hypothetical protein B0H65DRAFT_466250 [Neurospora tetraspora]
MPIAYSLCRVCCRPFDPSDDLPVQQTGASARLSHIMGHPFHLLAISSWAKEPGSQEASELGSQESRHCPPLPHRVRQIAPQGTRGWRPRVSCLQYRSHKVPSALLAESSCSPN